jgi:hypothetical protein
MRRSVSWQGSGTEGTGRCSLICPNHNGDCSFETILCRRDLQDPVPWDLARIVHEADLADDRYDAIEAPGPDIICRGLALSQPDDDVVITIGAALFDGLYRYGQLSLRNGRDPT